jgi:hypothetical protein
MRHGVVNKLHETDKGLTDNMSCKEITDHTRQTIHCKKGYQFSRPQPGCNHVTNQVWLVTSRLGTGKSLTFFTV